MNRSPQELVAAISNNGWCALDGIPFPELPLYYRQAASFLRDRGVVGGDQLRAELHMALRAICPTCSRWVTCSDIFTLSMAQEEDTCFTSYGPVSRMRDGRCPNADCSETNALIIWAGNPSTVEYIDSAFGYLLRDATPDDALRRYYRPDVVAYVADVVALNANANRRCSTGLVLRNDRGDDPVAVNITVVSGNPDPEWTRRNVFPQGYVSYLNELLSNPMCDHNEVALMHWTSVSDRQEAMLRLMFLDRKKTPPAPGCLRCPWDLMTPEEIRQFERT